MLQDRVRACEKEKSELQLQQLWQQTAGMGAGPSQLLANAGRLLQPGPVLGPGIVQGVAVGLPANMQVSWPFKVNGGKPLLS